VSAGMVLLMASLKTSVARCLNRLYSKTLDLDSLKGTRDEVSSLISESEADEGGPLLGEYPTVAANRERFSKIVAARRGMSSSPVGKSEIVVDAICAKLLT